MMDAKTHYAESADLVRISEDFLIDQGVGRSMRAFSKGEKYVNANIKRSYSSLDTLKQAAAEGFDVAKEDLRWYKRSTNIEDINNLVGHSSNGNIHVTNNHINIITDQGKKITLVVEDLAKW